MYWRVAVYLLKEQLRYTIKLVVRWVRHTSFPLHTWAFQYTATLMVYLFCFCCSSLPSYIMNAIHVGINQVCSTAPNPFGMHICMALQDLVIILSVLSRHPYNSHHTYLYQWLLNSAYIMQAEFRNHTKSLH